jgi:hypothetical protein
MKNSSLHSTRVTRAAVETAWSPDQAEKRELVFDISARIRTAVHRQTDVERNL